MYSITECWEGQPAICGSPGQLINSFFGKVNNLAFLKTDILRIFWPRTGLAKFFRALAQTAVNFRRNSFACGSLNFLSSYLRLFLRHLRRSLYLVNLGTRKATPPLISALQVGQVSLISFFT